MVDVGGYGADASGELERLLSETVTDCVRRERSAFDDASFQGDDSVVLFGAGRLGRRTLRALQRLGKQPNAFVDNDQALWGATVDGLQVLSPAEAALRYGRSATFVVTIWRAGGSHRFEHSRRQLRGLGCTHVTPIQTLAWKHAAEMLPHYCLDLPHKVLEEAKDVRRAFALLSDDRSRAEFVSQVRFRLTADLDGLASPDTEPQYLASGLFRTRADEVIVDGGAFDGDTLRSVISMQRRFDRYLALEPDETNFAALHQYVSHLPTELRQRVELFQLAAYSERSRMRIEQAGSASAVLVPVTDVPRASDVECVTLDGLLAARSVSFIKLDIEGAEPHALSGARETVARDRPILAICVYHEQKHLWQLPLLIQSMVDDYRYFLRPYNEEGWDLVCYAVPKERALAWVGAN